MSSFRGCERLFQVALQLAERSGLRSLAISPIGAGSAYLPLGQMARVICKTVLSESRAGRLNSLKQLRLVGFKERALRAFERALFSFLDVLVRTPFAPLRAITHFSLRTIDMEFHIRESTYTVWRASRSCTLLHHRGANKYNSKLHEIEL